VGDLVPVGAGVVDELGEEAFGLVGEAGDEGYRGEVVAEPEPAAFGRPSGSVYPLLDRLERAGWVTSSWDDDAERRGRGGECTG
jgi:hypothetical protein